MSDINSINEDRGVVIIKLREALKRTGSIIDDRRCWCAYKEGGPMVTKHSDACNFAWSVLNE
jgi:hypothetical protein